jgi:CBS domain-containing protein
MDTEVPSITADFKLRDLADRIARGEPGVSRHQGMVILDGEGKLAGIITRGDVLRALDQDPTGAMTVVEAGKQNVVVTHPDETLHEASEKMLRYNIGRLPVVDRADPRRVVGYIGRPGVMAARLRKFNDEYVREPGWLKGFHRGSTRRSE